LGDDRHLRREKGGPRKRRPAYLWKEREREAKNLDIIGDKKKKRHSKQEDSRSNQGIGFNSRPGKKIKVGRGEN